jgi:hypothetical protein
MYIKTTCRCIVRSGPAKGQTRYKPKYRQLGVYVYYYNAKLPLGTCTASRECPHSTLTNGLSLKPGQRRCPDRLLCSLCTPCKVLRIALLVGFPVYHGTVPRYTSTGSHTVVRPHQYGTSRDTNPAHPGRPHIHEALRPSASSSLAREFLSSLLCGFYSP